MMLDFKSAINKHGINIKGIIQAGVHYWQEKDVFVGMGVKDFVLIEPQEDIFNSLQAKTKDVNAILFNCAVFDTEGEMEMFCDSNNQSQSSSLLKPKYHEKIYPGIKFDRKKKVKVKKIENLDFDRSKYNVLVMDIQGAELNALKGSGNLLDYIEAIYTEVNFIEMYEGRCTIYELDKYLKDNGFIRAETGQNINNQGWSDAFYIKKN